MFGICLPSLALMLDILSWAHFSEITQKHLVTSEGFGLRCKKIFFKKDSYYQIWKETKQFVRSFPVPLQVLGVGGSAVYKTVGCEYFCCYRCLLNEGNVSYPLCRIPG